MIVVLVTWWRHQMETFSALLALCAGNSLVTGEFPAQRPVTRSFDVFFDLRLNKRWVNNHEAGDLRRHRVHCDVTVMNGHRAHTIASIHLVIARTMRVAWLLKIALQCQILSIASKYGRSIRNYPYQNSKPYNEWHWDFFLDDYVSNYYALLKKVPGIKIILLRYLVIEVYKRMNDINPDD